MPVPPPTIGICRLRTASDAMLEAVRKQQYPISRGTGIWSFTEVTDAAAATVAATTCGPPGIYNVVDDDYLQFRPLMFSIAYRMTGSISDAEDIVQEAFLRLTRALRDGAQVTSPKAYLATVTTRLAISHLRSARVRREAYVGAWLPEPIVEGGLAPATAPDPAERAEMSDSLSMAFLVLLESLTPTERAVFLLHEVFSYDYAEIAEITGKSEPNCRQIFARARHHIDEGKPRFEASREQRDEVARRFFDAVERRRPR